MLRRLSIMGRNYHRIGRIYQRTRASIIGIQICNDPTTTVIIHNNRKRPYSCRGINPNWNLATSTRNRFIFNFTYRFWLCRFTLFFSNAVTASAGVGCLRASTAGKLPRGFGPNFASSSNTGPSQLIRHASPRCCCNTQSHNLLD